MIGFLKGCLIAKAPPVLLLDVNGVGYEIEAPMTTIYQLPELGSVITLYTHLVIREDAHSLYGFIDDADRRLFRTLIKVNGVGPKMALTILSSQSAHEFRQAIQQGDMQSLIRLPGVGKKTAERLLIELRDILPPLVETARQVNPSSHAQTTVQEAISALCALGYKQHDANRMIQAIPDAETKTAEILIRLALQSSLR